MMTEEQKQQIIDSGKDFSREIIILYNGPC